MTDKDKLRADVLWKIYQDNIQQGRHHELQRSTVASVLIAISGAIVGIVTIDKTISTWDIPLTMLLMCLSLFGMLFSIKQYERFNKHMQRARHYRNELDKLLDGAPLMTLKKQADATHARKFRIFSQMRLNLFWTTLYSFIFILGLGLTVYAACTCNAVVNNQ